MTRTIRHRRFGRMLLAAALPLASLTATATSAPANARPTLLLPGSARLNGVYCTASTNCWAVGLKVSKTRAVLNEALRWNGKRWSAVSVPSLGGTTTASDFSQLVAVRCASPTDCWAVGTYDSAVSQFAQALHWTGGKWVPVTIPEPGGTHEGQFTELSDVACTSASDCWAVGDYGTRAVGSSVARNLALHWTGKKWFKVAVPNPEDTSENGAVNSLAAIRCASPKDCWAAGTSGVDSTVTIQENEMLHFNGTKWTEADVPNPAGFLPGAINEISSLSCTSTSNCWAVGDYGGGSGGNETFLNQALRWSGHNWTQVTTPNPDGTGDNDSNILNGVTCSAASNCWAVGNLSDSSDPGTGEALHWTGTKWSRIKTPSPGGSGSETQLSGVRCVSVKDCWAVGFSSKGTRPDHALFLHWNSIKWSTS